MSASAQVALYFIHFWGALGIAFRQSKKRACDPRECQDALRFWLLLAAIPKANGIKPNI